MTTTYVLLFIITVTFGFIQSALGFGFSTLSMIFLPMLFPFKDAVNLNIYIVILNNLAMVAKYIKYVEWKKVIPAVIPYIIVNLFLPMVTLEMDAQLLKFLLGILFMFLALWSWFFANKVKLEGSVPVGVAMGSITGVVNSFFGIAGPTAALYMLPASKNQESYVGNIQFFFTSGTLVNIMVRLAKGAFKSTYVAPLCIGWVGITIGMIMASRLVIGHIKDDVFKKIVYSFVGLNGLWIVISHFIGY
ncbi:MAG: sulfite exporter TauE/SafE family protein [Sphaerochaetaceae bacterium]|nr:sulfite exporter TauE/SafE family protein [Sphaerochaetaceae bacterium]